MKTPNLFLKVLGSMFAFVLSVQTLAQMPPPGLLRSIDVDDSDFSYLAIPFIPTESDVTTSLSWQIEEGGLNVFDWDEENQDWKNISYSQTFGWTGDQIIVEPSSILMLKQLYGDNVLRVSLGGLMPEVSYTQTIYPGLNHVGSPKFSQEDLTGWDWHQFGHAALTESEADTLYDKDNVSQAWLKGEVSPVWTGSVLPSETGLLLPDTAYFYESKSLQPFTATAEVVPGFSAATLPKISAVGFNADENRAEVEIQTVLGPSHSLDLFYQDVDLTEGFDPEKEWKVWELGLQTAAGEAFLIFDEGDVDRDHPQTPELRLYQVGDALLDADADGLSDAYEGLVLKTNPALSDSDADGIPDAWEVEHGLDPRTDPWVNLVSLHSFDEEPGLTQCLDQSSNLYHASPYNGKTTDVSWGPLLGAESMTDGNSGWLLSAGGSGSTGPYHDAFTQKSVSFWVKSTDALSRQVIYDQGGITHGFGVQLQNGNLQFGVKDQGVLSSLTVPGFPVDRWVHVAAVYDAGEMWLFVDGVLAALRDDAPAQISAHTSGAAWGASYGDDVFAQGAEALIGSLDDARLYQGALTTEQIAAIIEPGDDPDKDGFSTYHEYLRGTDPTDALSVTSWLYVSPQGQDHWTGWTNTYQQNRHGPLKNLDTALEKAANGDSVEISAGTYTHNGHTVPNDKTILIKPIGEVLLQPAP